MEKYKNTGDRADFCLAQKSLCFKCDIVAMSFNREKTFRFTGLLGYQRLGERLYIKWLTLNEADTLFTSAGLDKISASANLLQYSARLINE
jgi:hypothetical protein